MDKAFVYDKKRVIKYIQEKLENNELKLGDKIETERALSEKLLISRTLVREELKALVYGGILECTQGKGYYLKRNLNEALFETFKLFFIASRKNLRDILDFREAIEVSAFQLAIENISEESLSRMEKIVELMETDPTNEKKIELDIEFHKLIVESSKNIYFINVYSAARYAVEEFIAKIRDDIYSKEKGKEKFISHHRKIYEALRDKELIQGSLLMRGHFKIIRENI